MTTVYNLRAANNATFRWTRDFSAVAAAYDVVGATIRMQARTSPYAPDPPAYEWVTGASSGGVVAYDPVVHLAVFVAPEADMAAMLAPLVYDCRVELPGGESVVLFGGRILWSAGVTRAASDATSQNGVSGIGDTVSVDGETSTSPTPLPLSLSAALTAAQTASDAAAAAQVNVAAALLPANFGAAYEAWLSSLQTSASSPVVLAAGQYWNNGGIVQRIL